MREVIERNAIDGVVFASLAELQGLLAHADGPDEAHTGKTSASS